MLTRADIDQMYLEQIADALIDNDDYFNMTDPTSFLEWAVDNVPAWTDLDNDGDPVVDYEGMLYHWLDEHREAA